MLLFWFFKTQFLYVALAVSVFQVLELKAYATTTV